MAEFVAPTVTKVSFNCPRCGAHAHQTWYNVYVIALAKDDLPLVRRPDDIDEVIAQIQDDERREAFREILEKQASGEVYFVKSDDYNQKRVWNLSISECFSCNQISVWQYDRPIIPPSQPGPEPNPDLPKEVRADYDEASTILDLSPRGAAALLRLCIQKLCKHLGEPGEKLNNDIAALMARGLDVRIQKALDIVRVIGNNAVHPGKIDLKDDRETATKLFDLVNLITDTMISQPDRIDAMYGNLPPGALEQIAKRDGKDS